MIGDDVRVMVAAVNGQRVRLGITAPPSIPVARLELLASGAVFGALQTVGDEAEVLKTPHERRAGDGS